jgi:hypothetical protein
MPSGRDYSSIPSSFKRFAMKTFICVKFSLAFLFLLAVSAASGGPVSDGWHSGKVELQTGEWLTGELHFKPELGLLEFSMDGVLSTLSARKVASFYYFEPESNRVRNFIVEQSDENGRLVPSFFEVLVDGRIRLLGKEQPQRLSWHHSAKEPARMTYFFQTPDGAIEKYRGRLHQIYAVLSDRRDEVSFFVRRINWYQLEEKPVVELFRYCNAL